MKFVESVEVGEAGAGLKGEGAGLEGQGAGPRPIPFHFFFRLCKRHCDTLLRFRSFQPILNFFFHFV